MKSKYNKLTMPIINNETLLASLQAVFKTVNHYETLLDSETLRDPENISELLFFYEEALETLKGVYEEEIDKGENLPPLQAIIKPTKISRPHQQRT
ncbi:hypothetical protein ACJJIK_17075 [Microbulbifer sp. ZKSA006]|uniref:hypothetical protein n=1 Tax=Microbulbifer sp. ZKSA006 TaxID=3243390 RepID=UPI00403A4E5F